MIISGENDCMVVATRSRCKNMLEGGGSYEEERCEINMPPLVGILDHLDNIKNWNSEKKIQYLECRSDLNGYRPCAQFRLQNQTQSLNCDPLGKYLIL